MIITVIGYMFFAEQINGLKIFSILLIIAGVVLLNLSGARAGTTEDAPVWSLRAIEETGIRGKSRIRAALVPPQ